ncbi:MAG: lipopolysaccharide biosynthesis protein, partial [Pseudomonadota bacterium]|nr:lipopolysaccharide biosynthesis protein [Pseudomonadota bacterium]
ADEATRFAKLVRSVTRIAALAGIVVLLTAILFGEQALVLIGGSDYARAAVVLIPLAFAAAFELASVSYEPMLYATGHAGRALKVRAIAVVTLIVSIVALQSGGGPVEIGWAVALSMGVFYFCMSIAAWVTLRHLRKADAET